MTNKYYCYSCEREVDDRGPYEKADGDYCCQDCMEGNYEKISSNIC